MTQLERARSAAINYDRQRQWSAASICPAGILGMSFMADDVRRAQMQSFGA